MIKNNLELDKTLDTDMVAKAIAILEVPFIKDINATKNNAYDKLLKDIRKIQ